MTTWLTHVPSCYRASFKLSPVGICWLRYHPSAIVPRLISSLFQFELFHRSEVRGPPGLICTLSKEKAAPDIWKWKLQLMVPVPEPGVKTSNDLFCQKRHSTPTTQSEKISHLRESGTEIWRFYLKYSTASQSSLFDWLIISLSLVMTCGRDLKTYSFSHLNVSAAVPNGWGTRVNWWVARYVRHDLFICPKRAWSITAAAHLPVSAPFFCRALCHLCETLIALFQSCHSVSDVNARPPGY